MLMQLVILCFALLIAGVVLAVFAVRGWQKEQPVRKITIACAVIGIGLLAAGTAAYVYPVDTRPVIRTLADIRALPDGSPALLEGHVSNFMRAVEGSYVAYVDEKSESHTPVLLITLSDGSEITLSDGDYSELNWPADGQVHYLTNGDPVVIAGQVRQWTEELGNCEYVGQRSAGFLFFSADTVFAGSMDSYLAYLNPAWPIARFIPYIGWIAGGLLIGLSVWLWFRPAPEKN
jgi:hypothetical protein